jgi:hypothetical protein
MLLNILGLLYHNLHTCLTLFIKLKSEKLGKYIVNVDYYTLGLCNSVPPTDCGMAEVASCSGGRGSLIGLWCTKWQWGRFCSEYFSLPVSPRTILIFHVSTTNTTQSLQLKVSLQSRSVTTNITNMATMPTTWEVATLHPFNGRP